MTIIGALRIKNEARWIERVLRSLVGICERIVILDDHSIDDTPDICQACPNVVLYPSRFEGLDEARDKNWLLERVQIFKPDWILWIDGDEILPAEAQGPLLDVIQNPNVSCLSLRIRYLWNDEQTVRVDGVYGDFHRESVFRPNGARFFSSNGGHFHCGNVPQGNRIERRVLDVPLLHLGYMDREDRVRKYAWYNRHDPGNAGEDFYRHMVIGDLFPADSRFQHGGPLQLAPL